MRPLKYHNIRNMEFLKLKYISTYYNLKLINNHIIISNVLTTDDYIMCIILKLSNIKYDLRFGRKINLYIQRTLVEIISGTRPHLY